LILYILKIKFMPSYVKTLSLKSNYFIDFVFNSILMWKNITFNDWIKV